MKMEEFMGQRRPAEVFHPGEHLLDELNARGWTQTELAEIIGRPVRLINEIINGRRGITPDTARELGAALGTSAEFWMNLDAAYDLWKADADLSSIEHRAQMRNLYPIRDMVLRGWILSSEDTRVVESQLFRFFEVSALDERPRLAATATPKRSGSADEELTPIQIAWVYRVKHIAATMQVPRYSKKLLRAAIAQLANIREAPEEIRHVPRLLEATGVRLVVVEPLPSSKIDGVTFWLDDYSPVIGLSLRFDRIDNFWFVLRHEIDHVLNEDRKGALIVDSELERVVDDEEHLPEEEKRANLAAAEFCAPQAELMDFIARVAPFISRVKVLAFARMHRLHPGLVAGQLQRHLNRFSLFRQMLVPVRAILVQTAMTDGYGHVLPVEF